MFSPGYFGLNNVRGSSCVADGAFASPAWTTTTGGCLRRDLDMRATAASLAEYARLFADNPDPGDFFDFSRRLESGAGFHGHVHTRIVGGTMSARSSANDPIFVLHHANVDKIWSRWQDMGKVHRKAFGPGSVDNIMDTSAPGAPAWSVNDVLDLRNQPDDVCVEYRSSGVTEELFEAAEARESQFDVGSLPRARILPEPTLLDENGEPSEWARFMSDNGMSDDEIAAVVEEYRRHNAGEFGPIVEDESQLSPAEQVLGFRLTDELLESVATIEREFTTDDGGECLVDGGGPPQ